MLRIRAGTTTHIFLLVSSVTDAQLRLLPLGRRGEVIVIVIIRVENHGSANHWVRLSTFARSDLVLRAKRILELVMI